MTIGTNRLLVTVPSEKWLKKATEVLEEVRLDDLLGHRAGLYPEDNPLELRLDLEALKAATIGGDTLVRETSDSGHLTVDPGDMTFAGIHSLGPFGSWIALTHEAMPDMQDWYWPLTGEYSEVGDKPIDGLVEGDHVIVAVPYKPEQRVAATLIVPAYAYAGRLDTGLTAADQDRIGGDRCVMPTTWVFETLIAGLTHQP